MTDREKTIKGLELCSNILGCIGNVNPECPYALRDGGCRHQELLYDALALLREQDTVDHALDVLRANGWKDETEPVEPKPTGIEPNYNCGKCGLPIQQGYPFCPWCGKAVKWDA